MDTHVESEAFLQRQVAGGAATDFAAAMLPFLRQERAIHMRGNGAFLWSAPFDIDTPGMRPLKISVDARASLCAGPLRDMYQVWPFLSPTITYHVIQFIRFYPCKTKDAGNLAF